MLPIAVSLTRIDRSITDPAAAADAIAGQYTELVRIHDAYLQAFVTHALAFAEAADADVAFSAVHDGAGATARFTRGDRVGQACLSVDVSTDLTEAYVSVTYWGWKVAGKRIGTYLVPVAVSLEALAAIHQCGLTGPDTYRHTWREYATEIVEGLGGVLPNVDLSAAAAILAAQADA